MLCLNTNFRFFAASCFCKTGMPSATCLIQNHSPNQGKSETSLPLENDRCMKFGYFGNPGYKPFNGLVSPNSSIGFTLLELMLVMFVVILGFAVIGLNISTGSDAAGHQSAARDLVSALRFAKGQALIGHEQTTVEVNLNENSYTVSGRDKVFSIPEGIELTVVTAQEELTGEGLAGIRFFPDGSSTGGRIKLERNGALWQIDINWLTGQITLENK